LFSLLIFKVVNKLENETEINFIFSKTFLFNLGRIFPPPPSYSSYSTSSTTFFSCPDDFILHIFFFTVILPLIFRFSLFWILATIFILAPWFPYYCNPFGYFNITIEAPSSLPSTYFQIFLNPFLFISLLISPFKHLHPLYPDRLQ
jgi:hypothetical protein